MNPILTEKSFVDRLALQLEQEELPFECCVTDYGSTLFTLDMDMPKRGPVTLEIECNKLVPNLITYRYRIKNQFTKENLTPNLYSRLNEIHKEAGAFKFMVDGSDLIIQTTNTFSESKDSPIELFITDYYMLLVQFSICDKDFFGNK